MIPVITHQFFAGDALESSPHHLCEHLTLRWNLAHLIFDLDEANLAAPLVAMTRLGAGSVPEVGVVDSTVFLGENSSRSWLMPFEEASRIN